MATLKTIAEKAGVSIVTVHKCIYHKPGVGDETRARVLAIAEELHYLSGTAARKQTELYIAVVAPDSRTRENSFFRNIHKGIDAAVRVLEPQGVRVRTCFTEADWHSQQEALQALSHESGLHGVLLYCMDDKRLNDAIAQLRQKNITVITFNSDAPDSGRLAHVAPPSRQMGELAAEMLCKLAGAHERILIVGGDKRLTVLRENTTGFYGYIQLHHPEISLLEINNTVTRNLESELTKVLLSLGDITGIYCSMTRNGVPVCKVLQELGLQAKIRLVCTDVFEGLRPFIEDGTVDATVWQDPYSQSYNAMLLLFHYLRTGRLREEYFRIRISPVMRSNFDDYL